MHRYLRMRDMPKEILRTMGKRLKMLRDNAEMDQRQFAHAVSQRGSRAAMLAEVAAAGPAMLTTDDTTAANAWLRRRVRVFVADNQVTRVRFDFW